MESRIEIQLNDNIVSVFTQERICGEVLIDLAKDIPAGVVITLRLVGVEFLDFLFF